MALGINHQSPLIHFISTTPFATKAGNQSPIPFDTLMLSARPRTHRWESITNPL